MQYIDRTIDSELIEWSVQERRKTLLLRGARQVGKSSAVRHFAQKFKYFVEVNFEDDKPVRRYFMDDGASPKDICNELALYYRTPIIPGETLVFFDEIQAHLPALSKLRYFYEKYPELHLVAAGSLLEFAVEEIPSFAVGRIRSLYVYPLSFKEFLRATGNGILTDAIRTANPSSPLSEPIHNQLIKLLKYFFITGGMPEVVAEFVQTGDLLACQLVQDDLIISLRNDFAKYRKKIPALRIQSVFESVVHQIDGKFVYEHVGDNISNAQAKMAVELLIMAGLVHPVTHTAANGIPIGAESDYKYRRMFLLDTGLFQRIIGLDASKLLVNNDFKTINNGALAEMFVGLELLKSASCYQPSQLYCWHRQKKQSNAQIDFLIQKGEQIIPIEVKAGTKGSMQSLRIFMEEKRCYRGIRTSLENFGHVDNIDIYPLYAIANLANS